ncbi:MAG: DUF4190 domain-containing protein [Lachnospiraceae bacterium]|nr:DUF4190 domain-containing protein [Lachnospiraceae bacterium]
MDERNEKDIVNLENPNEEKDTLNTHAEESTQPETVQPESSQSEEQSPSGQEESHSDPPPENNAGAWQDNRSNTAPPGNGEGAWQNRNWQNQSAGPGGPPPGYGRNNWQGGPPPGYGHGGYNPNGNGYPPYNAPKKSNNMALASLLLGILSLVLCCCGGFGVILGAVGIVLAILSRGNEPMETSAKVGLGLSIGGIVLGIIVLVMSFVVAGSDQFRNDLNRGGYGNYESYRHYFEHDGL